MRLRDLGNTLIVVEHDEATILEADHIVDIGPAAGEHGGEVVYAGDLKGLLECDASMTGAFLSGRRTIPVPSRRRAPTARKLRLEGAREHNLKNVTVDLPLGLMVCGHGRERLGQVHPGPRRPAPGADAEGLPVAAPPGQAQAAWWAGSRSTR